MTEKFRCVICNYKTLPERGANDICPVCFWEDDGAETFWPPDVKNPCNHVSFNEARENFKAFGACDRRCLSFVRPPRDDEV